MCSIEEGTRGKYRSNFWRTAEYRANYRRIVAVKELEDMKCFALACKSFVTLTWTPSCSLFLSLASDASSFTSFFVCSSVFLGDWCCFVHTLAEIWLYLMGCIFSTISYKYLAVSPYTWECLSSTTIVEDMPPKNATNIYLPESFSSLWWYLSPWFSLKSWHWVFKYLCSLTWLFSRSATIFYGVETQLTGYSWEQNWVQLDYVWLWGPFLLRHGMFPWGQILLFTGVVCV